MLAVMSYDWFSVLLVVLPLLSVLTVWGLSYLGNSLEMRVGWAAGTLIGTAFLVGWFIVLESVPHGYAVRFEHGPLALPEAVFLLVALIGSGVGLVFLLDAVIGFLFMGLTALRDRVREDS